MTTKNNILLIEDDPLVSQTIADVLREDGYLITISKTMHEAQTSIHACTLDAILLDISLPDGNGLDLIDTIRKQTMAPIIVVSGHNTMPEKVHGLDKGADDYITKPMDMNELSARLRAQIRRYKTADDKQTKTISANAAPTNATKLGFGNYVMDRGQMQVFRKGGLSINLTAREFRMLEILTLAPKQVFTREQLLNRVQGDNLDITDRAVDVQMLRIRRKLDDHAGPDQLIKAVRGAGYMLACDVSPL